MINLIKSGCGKDGFLQWLHLLVLMIDSVLLSTTRGGTQHKLALLSQFCADKSVLANNLKSDFSSQFIHHWGIVSRSHGRDCAGVVRQNIYTWIIYTHE